MLLRHNPVDDGMMARYSQKSFFADFDREVVLLRFGHDYDPECKLTDDVLLALSDTVKDCWPEMLAVTLARLWYLVRPSGI